MTPTEKAIQRKIRLAQKNDLRSKIEYGDLQAMANEGSLHYNSYRNFFNDDNYWSDTVCNEAKAYFHRKQQAIESATV